MFKKDSVVKVRKIAEVPEGIHASKAEDWLNGQINEGKSPPISYEAEGMLLRDLRIEEPLRMLRTHRNNVEILGLFESSPIKNIYIGTNNTATLKTLNSIYFVELINK